MWCQINLFEHSDNKYRPGDRVHGTVRYILKEETTYDLITVSLKGFGKLHITWSEGTGKNRRNRSYINKETYVDIDNVIHNNEKNAPIPAGTYEAPFSFMLPQNIPSTFKQNTYVRGYSVYCELGYYVRIKFGRPGMFKKDKRFKTVLNVVGTTTPTMSSAPVMYAVDKKPYQPFWKKNSAIVSIKGTLENPVVSPGGQVKINYVVDNGTKLNLKGVKINLTQETAFQRYGLPVVELKTLASCTTSPVVKDDFQCLEFLLDIPSDAMNLQHSILVSRNYFVSIVAVLPFPHRDAVMKAPIDIVYDNLSPSTRIETVQYNDPPPSYSEAMAEYSKDDFEK